MPRIAASVGVFALIVFSIGFNMARYPRVWEMVGGPSQLSQPGQSLQPGATTEPVSVPQAETAEQPTTSWQTTRIALADDVLPPPEEVAAAPKYASLAGQIDTFGESGSGKALVPVTPPDVEMYSDLEQDAADPSGLGPEVTRLPTIDRAGSADAGRLASRSAQMPIPDYPSTGIE